MQRKLNVYQDLSSQYKTEEFEKQILFMSIFRMCRADSRGVFEIPPGEPSCCLYLNGPASAVGVVAASGLVGGTTSLSSLVGVGGLFSVMSMFSLRSVDEDGDQEGDCPLLSCRARSGQCCLILFDRGRPICPLNC